MAVDGRGGFVAGADEADDLELVRTPIAVFENLQPIDAEGEELGSGRRLGLVKRWLPKAWRRPARRFCLTRGAFDVASCALGHTSCLSLPGESD